MLFWFDFTAGLLRAFNMQMCIVKLSRVYPKPFPNLFYDRSFSTSVFLFLLFGGVGRGGRNTYVEEATKWLRILVPKRPALPLTQVSWVTNKQNQRKPKPNPKRNKKTKKPT